MKKLSAIYNDGKESFTINFDSYPEKFEQLKIAIPRGRSIEILINTKQGVRKILSDYIEI